MDVLITAGLVVLAAVALAPVGVLAWHLCEPPRGMHAGDGRPLPPFELPGPRTGDPSLAERISAMPSPWPPRPAELHHEPPGPPWPAALDEAEADVEPLWEPRRPLADWLRDSVVMEAIREGHR